MAPRTAALMLVLLLSGCGKDSPTGPLPAQCRRYATAFTTTPTNGAGEPAGEEEAATCTFDRPSTTLRCTYTYTDYTYTDGDPTCVGTRTESAVYASVVDFAEEAAAVGRLRRQQLRTATSRCSSSSTSIENITYDGMKRPLTAEYESSQGLQGYSTFTAWDALGRPTQQVSDYLNCAHHRFAYTYDDTARTWTARTVESGTGNLCLSADYAYTVAYDSDGNVVRQVTFQRGATREVRITTIASTATVCF